MPRPCLRCVASQTLAADGTLIYFRRLSDYSREESWPNQATKALPAVFRAPMGATVALGTPWFGLFRLRNWAIEKCPRRLHGRPKYLYASCRLCLSKQWPDAADRRMADGEDRHPCLAMGRMARAVVLPMRSAMHDVRCTPRAMPRLPASVGASR